MHRATRARRRPGFTLIEVLVVVAILALLTALVAAGIGRVKNAQLSRNTEGTVTKLQQALDTQWKTVIDQCRKDSKGTTSNSTNYAAIKAACGGDPDRSLACWTYLNLKRELPQTFAEATTAITFGGVTLQPRATFAAVSSGSMGPSPNGVALTQQQAEAAVLLYLILSEKSNSGANFAADEAMNGGLTSLGSFRVFADAWGTPVLFIRFADATISPELGGVPYAAAGHPDPIDPLSKLYTTGTGWPAAQQTAFQNAMNGSGAAPQLQFTGAATNKLATVVAAGPDLTFGLNGNDDDYFGYRYRRQGNK